MVTPQTPRGKKYNQARQSRADEINAALQMLHAAERLRLVGVRVGIGNKALDHSSGFDSWAKQ